MNVDTIGYVSIVTLAIILVIVFATPIVLPNIQPPPIILLDMLIPPIYTTSTNYTYYIDDTNFKGKDLQYIHDAFKEWDMLNDNISFIYVNDAADITVHFEDSNSVIGGLNGCIYDECKIILYQGNTDCNNIFQPITKQQADIIIKHEIGHAIGIKHNNIKGNLMYSTIDPITDYNPRNLTIPDKESHIAIYQREQEIYDTNNIQINQTGLYQLSVSDSYQYVIDTIYNMNIPDSIKEEIKCIRDIQYTKEIDFITGYIQLVIMVFTIPIHYVLDVIQI